MAKLNTTVSRLVPSLGDKLAAKLVSQLVDDTPPRDPEGALYRPTNDGRVHGGDAQVAY